MCQHHQDDLRQRHQAMNNRAHVRTLLREKQPGFLALLQSVERELDCELACDPRETRTGWPATA
jgi:hypothetical protein